MRRGNRRARPRGANRAGFFLLALGVAAQFLSFLHLVVVPHVTCLVHDELVHGANVLGPGERARAEEHEAGGARIAAQKDGTHDTHCGIALLLRPVQPVFAGSSCSVLVARAQEPVEAPLVRVERAHGFPLYLLAPKASPPLIG